MKKHKKGEITRVKNIRMVDLVSKKHCKVMVELNFAPTKPISEKDIRETVFLVTWDDGTQGQYQLVDIYRFTLASYCTHFTWPSHGMDFYEFYNFWKEQHPEIDSETVMAAYFYRKIF